MSSKIPAENAMDCLEAISKLLKRLNPTDVDRPVKLDEEQINELILIKGDFEDHKKRIIVIAATSYFEEQITNTIHGIYERLNDAVVAESFFKMLFEGKYHQLFHFERRLEGMKKDNNFYPNFGKINTFFNFFGESFKKWFAEHYPREANGKPKNLESEKMMHSIKCFLLLNSIRNKIVHGGYNTVDSIIHAKDSEKFYNDFKDACNFIEWLPWAIEESEKWEKERRDKSLA